MAINIFRWKQLEIAYKEGVSLVTTMQSHLEALTDAASVLGLFMVGALIATMINVKIAAVPEVFGVALDIQNYLDMILSRMVPALIAGGVYWLLGKKGMSSTKAIFIVIAIIVALAALGEAIGMDILTK